MQRLKRHVRLRRAWPAFREFHRWLAAFGASCVLLVAPSSSLAAQESPSAASQEGIPTGTALTAAMSWIPIQSITVTPDSAFATVELVGGRTLSVPSSVAVHVSEQRSAAGLSNVVKSTSTTATASRSAGASSLVRAHAHGDRAHKASIEEDLGCATAYLKLTTTFNVGLDVHTGFKNWNYVDGIPDWVQWKAEGENITFGRDWEKLWSEIAELNLEGAWARNHLAEKGGGEYYAQIVPFETYILSDEGVCVLETYVLNEKAYVDWN